MSSTVFTSNTLDPNTGEIIQKKWINKQVKNKEMFVRTYIEDIGLLAKCNKSEQSVILCSLKYLDYGTNEFLLTPARRKELCECADIKMNTVNMAISSLYKKDILIKRNGSTYLNPKLFFYGTDLDREKQFQLIINYNIVE